MTNGTPGAPGPFEWPDGDQDPRAWPGGARGDPWGTAPPGGGRQPGPSGYRQPPPQAGQQAQRAWDAPAGWWQPEPGAGTEPLPPQQGGHWQGGAYGGQVSGAYGGPYGGQAAEQHGEQYGERYGDFFGGGAHPGRAGRPGEAAYEWQAGQYPQIEKPYPVQGQHPNQGGLGVATNGAWGAAHGQQAGWAGQQQPQAWPNGDERQAWPWPGEPAAMRGQQVEDMFAPSTGRPRVSGRAGGGARVRKVWPQRTALAAVIIVVMIICWYWVFPWLEGFLPSEF